MIELQRMRTVEHIHFVGIGGVGMSGIAEVLLHEGYQISGSDLAENSFTEHLKELGAQIYIGHHPQQVENVDVVVMSTAVPDDNCEIVAAREQNIPIVPRALMLAELMRFRFGIAVAGTHGKTTTTSLVASLLTEGGLDPTFVIGGRLNSAGSTAYLGESRYLVAEADESDASFLYLTPMVAIVTNIDADHMSTYGGDFSQLRKTFHEFLHHLPFYGLAVLCIDDPEVKTLRDEVSRPVITYGFDESADVCALDYQALGLTSTFNIHFKSDDVTLPARLNLAGRHNVLNALSAVAIARELGVSDEAIIKGLQEFKGIGRRMQVYGDYQIGSTKVTLIDDYGHHPREIAVTVQALKESFPNRRIVMVFQPHRYSRTRDLYDDFVNVLSELNVLILLDVYSAGELLISGADSRSLGQSIRNRGVLDPILVSDQTKLKKILSNIVCDGDIILMQGAGTIGQLASSLAQEFCNQGVETESGE